MLNNDELYMLKLNKIILCYVMLLNTNGFRHQGHNTSFILGLMASF